jgi:hypothetical protein
LPAPQSEQENCVAHNGSIVPVPGRDIFVQDWYQCVISVLYFTDSHIHLEIAYFDRGPLDDEYLVFGGYWSVYWYGGRIYGTETIRGLDVLSLLPSEYLSANEIAAAQLADQGGVFNPQQQFPVSWPADPVVARAYLDQLTREKSLSDSFAAELAVAIDLAEAELEAGGGDAEVKSELQSLAAALQMDAGNSITSKRRAGLAETLHGIAAQL